MPFRPLADPGRCRPLSRAERGVISHVIDHCDPEDRNVLVVQVENAAVTGRCDCGCRTVYLSVDQDVIDASWTRRARVLSW